MEVRIFTFILILLSSLVACTSKKSPGTGERIAEGAFYIEGIHYLDQNPVRLGLQTGKSRTSKYCHPYRISRRSL